MPATAPHPAPHVRTHPVPHRDWTNEAGATFLLILFLSLGALGMLPVTRACLKVWSDPLRSFGILIPFAAVAVMVRAWRALHWQRRGTAWGLLPLAAAVLLGRLSDGVRVAYRVGTVTVEPLQPGLLIALFFVGVLLLLAGPGLLRRCLFPLGLLLFVNPVPHAFTTWIDLPLQALSANVARAFAHSIGLRPSGEQLTMMFTPRFGMTIVPGCNGMRGSATLAYTMLLIGYVRRYRPAWLALAVAAAAFLGYLLNFLRLCLLVIYYWIGVHVPRLQSRGELVDYCIGGTIFLLLGTLAGALWLRGRPGRGQAEQPVPWPVVLRRPSMAWAAAVLLLAGVTELPSAFALLRRGTESVDPASVASLLPVRAGVWSRGITSQDSEDGRPVWQWVTYADGSGRVVDFGVWLTPEQHYLLDSLRMHGERPDWQSGFAAEAAGGVPVRFSTLTYVDDSTPGAAVTPTFMAETTCTPGACNYQAPVLGKQGFSVTMGPLALSAQLRLPVLFRVKHPGGQTVTPQQRAADEAAVADLVHGLDVRELVSRVGHP